MSFSGDHPSLRGRATSFVLAVAITLLILLGFLGLNGRMPKRPEFKGSPILLDLGEDTEKAAASDKKAVAKEAGGSKSPPPRPRPIPIVKLPPVPSTPPSPPTPFILLTKQEDEDFTLSMRRAPPGAGQQQASTAGDSMAGDSKAVGTAPNGEPLYEAQWYRRPTHAELNAYLPRIMPDEGSGLVACRTVERYHVDDCVELGSSPPGSHLAGAVRQAAWQFLVRPPRLGGKELIGTWVRIRIDYRTITQSGAE
jgi:protein TonB